MELSPGDVCPVLLLLSLLKAVVFVVEYFSPALFVEVFFFFFSNHISLTILSVRSATSAVGCQEVGDLLEFLFVGTEP